MSNVIKTLNTQKCNLIQCTNIGYTHIMYTGKQGVFVCENKTKILNNNYLMLMTIKKST